jgi:hypothetical protein
MWGAVLTSSDKYLSARRCALLFGAKNGNLGSTRSPFEKYTRRAVAGSLFVGTVILMAALYSFLGEANFVRRATPFDAALVEVHRQYVPKGRGSALAYVPIVEIVHAQKLVRIPVDTFSEEPVYNVGGSMDVLCDLSSQRCIKNSFFEKWGNSLLGFALSFVFLLIPALCWRSSTFRSRRVRNN